MILRWLERFRTRRSTVSVSSNAGVTARRDIRDSPITIINQSDNTEVLARIDDLARQLAALGPAPASAATEARVGEAIGDIARGASEGDQRLQAALDLLQANKIADAVQMLQAVAEDKVARIKQDSKDAAVAYRNLGAIAGLGDPKQALEAYRKAVELDADDIESLLWVGWIEMERGRLDAAEHSFRDVLALAKGDGAARHRYWAQLGLGDIHVQRGDLAAARADYLEAAAIADRLATADPGNAGWQRDLSVSHERIGDVQVAQGNLPAALTSFQAALAIRDRLARADPGNAGWQRDLSVSHERIGDVQVAQGNLPAALTSFQAALAIRDRLARADPGNAGWQRDLSVSHDRIGDVQRAQGNLPAALTSFQAAHDIFDRLAQADPCNAGWQRDLAVANERIGDVHSRLGETVQAIAAFERAFHIYRELQGRHPGDIPSRVFSVVPLWRLGRLKGRGGRADLEAALAILKPLAAADRLDANRRGWIEAIEDELAALSA